MAGTCRDQGRAMGGDSLGWTKGGHILVSLNSGFAMFDSLEFLMKSPSANLPSASVNIVSTDSVFSVNAFQSVFPNPGLRNSMVSFSAEICLSFYALTNHHSTMFSVRLCAALSCPVARTLTLSSSQV